MIRILMFCALVMGLVHLYRSRYQSPPPPPPPALKIPPAPALTPAEIERVRMATKDNDPGVRWAAIELLYRLRDPHAPRIMAETLSMDTEPSVRMKALALLRQTPEPAAAEDLLLALRDPEKEVRIAALAALSDAGDLSLAPYVSALLTDSDPQVRIQALQTLSRFQEQKRRDRQILTDKLKADYEEAVRKAERKRRAIPTVESGAR